VNDFLSWVNQPLTNIVGKTFPGFQALQEKKTGWNSGDFWTT
jgi:hypothetical protein